jgi:hypothetical protein
VILAAHQPDLLPYTGFWYKMAKADVFDLALHDQYQAKGYQRRVMMRDSWASLLLVGKPRLVPITEVRMQEYAPNALIQVIRGRYAGSRYWHRRGPQLLDAIAAAPCEYLWEFNTALIFHVRKMLGIETAIVSLPEAPVGNGIDGLINLSHQYVADSYLSGTGGRAYMGDDPERVFMDNGLQLEWSKHEITTGDSIVSVLMDYKDPMEIIMKEHS